MIAAHDAPWWMLIFQAVLLVGVVCFFVQELVMPIIRGCMRLWQAILYPAHKLAPSEEFRDEHRDPTRPRSWEDMAARVVVSERMKQFDKPKK